MRKKIRFVSATAPLVAMIIVVGLSCAHSQPPRATIAEQASRLPRTEVPLNTFGTFEIARMAMAPDISANEGKAKLANQFAQDIDATLKPVLADWSSSAPADSRARTVVIQPRLAAIHIVTYFSAFRSDDSKIDLELVLTDKASSRSIGTARINASMTQDEAVRSRHAFDKALQDEVVQIVRQYLVDNYKR
jgi:hypothetical protein